MIKEYAAKNTATPAKERRSAHKILYYFSELCDVYSILGF